MSEQQQATVGPMAAWRERRRAKRQERMETRYYQLEQARSAGYDHSYDEIGAATRAGAYVTPWMFGGSDFGGGGCGGDGGGCGGGC
jgi:hypothetical protein